MEQFLDAAHYADVLGAFRKSHGKTMGNLTALTKELRRVIAEGRLFYEEFSHTLLVYRDEGGYWQMLLLADGIDDESAVHSEKPCCCSIPFTPGREKPSELAAKEKVEGLGFSLEHRYFLYKVDVERAWQKVRDWIEPLEKSMNAAGYRQMPFDASYADDIHALWEKYLRSDYYTKEQWEFRFDTENMQLIFDMNFSRPRLIAVNFICRQGNTWLASGGAVEKAYRGKMVGFYLKAIQTRRAHAAGMPCWYGWIHESNHASVALNTLVDAKRANAGLHVYCRDGKQNAAPGVPQGNGLACR